MSEDSSDYIGELEGGETCQACGKTYHTIYRVPDEVWVRIAPRDVGPHREHMEGGLLCVDCAWERARAYGTHGMTLYFEGQLGGWPDDTAAQTRAAWADHFRAMGWAPPEEVEELREALRQLIQRSEDIISEKWNCGDPDVECPLQDATKDWHLQGDINRARSALDGIDAVTARHTD